MANRAYLYSSDRSDAWERPYEDYYDSRWTIPLAWFFFYQPENIRLVDVDSGGSHWKEVKFSAGKHDAVALFAIRERLLMSLVEGTISRDIIARFVATVEKRSGYFLLMDPEEVLGGMAGDDLGHAERFAQILTCLGSGEGSSEAIREAARPYVGAFDPNLDRCLYQVIGYTYS